MPATRSNIVEPTNVITMLARVDGALVRRKEGNQFRRLQLCGQALNSV